jgi:hypothetical protein
MFSARRGYYHTKDDDLLEPRGGQGKLALAPARATGNAHDISQAGV